MKTGDYQKKKTVVLNSKRLPDTLLSGVVFMGLFLKCKNGPFFILACLGFYTYPIKGFVFKTIAAEPIIPGIYQIWSPKIIEKITTLLFDD